MLEEEVHASVEKESSTKGAGYKDVVPGDSFQGYITNLRPSKVGKIKKDSSIISPLAFECLWLVG
jgi:hypothetical protein